MSTRSTPSRSSELRICRRMRSGASPVSSATPSVEWKTFVETVTGCLVRATQRPSQVSLRQPP